MTGSFCGWIFGQAKLSLAGGGYQNPEVGASILGGVSGKVSGRFFPGGVDLLPEAFDAPVESLVAAAVNGV
ncbi:MAG: hypothetical protein Tsb0017_24010 [Geothermobacteraceae bacterium]